MTPQWLYLAAGILIAVASAWQIGYDSAGCECEEVEPDDGWGFNQVRDGGVCDGGEPEWEDEY